VVVVSHVLTILGLCRHTNPLNNITNEDIPNTSLNIFRVCGITGQWTLERWGDVRHLEGN
jgi:probable phosphoglycerate mutase